MMSSALSVGQEHWKGHEVDDELLSKEELTAHKCDNWDIVTGKHNDVWGTGKAQAVAAAKKQGHF